MADIINFNDRKEDTEPDATDCETIFWCDWKRLDGTTARLDLLKNFVTGQICIGTIDDFDSNAEGKYTTFDDFTVMCEDEDDFISNKLIDFVLEQ